MSDRLSSRICENSPQTNGKLLSISNQMQPGVLNLEWSICTKNKGTIHSPVHLMSQTKCNYRPSLHLSGTNDAKIQQLVYQQLS